MEFGAATGKTCFLKDDAKCKRLCISFSISEVQEIEVPRFFKNWIFPVADCIHV
jgi:hypothetical protein